MAKITQALTRASKEYDQKTLQSLIRDLDGVINKLNTSFQEELRQEIDAQSFLYGIMAVINQYKMYGVTSTSATKDLLNFLVRRL